MNDFKLGTAIKMIRVRKGLKAKHVANRLGVTPSTLCKYESNERKIKAEMIPSLANALDVSVEFIYAQNVDDTPTSKAKTSA